MTDSTTREILLEHYQHPQNMLKPNNFQGEGRSVNLSCGDEVSAYVSIENNVIKKINFQAQACAITIASSSILSEKLIGQSIQRILKLNAEDLHSILGFSPTPNRLRCAHTALKAIQTAVLAVDEGD